MQRRFFLFSPLLLAQEPAPIRVSVNLVNVPFSVRDERGQWVTNLSPEDFEVFEDGVAQKIAFFSRATDSALSLAVVADVSGSQEDYLKEHRRDLRDFLKAVLRPRDQAMLAAFGNSVRLVSPFDKEAERLDEALMDFHKTKNASRYPKLGAPENRSGGSAFYDALVASAEELGTREGRRALIVFSDGEDNASALHLLDAIETAQQKGVTVFCLRYTEIRKGTWNARNKYGRSVMQRIGAETGGLDFDAGETKNLEVAFREIAAMLRSTYDLAYTSNQPEQDGSFRKLKIRATNRALQLRHKSGYYARPS